MDPRRKVLERKAYGNLQTNCAGGKEGSLDSKADWILAHEFRAVSLVGKRA